MHRPLPGNATSSASTIPFLADELYRQTRQEATIKFKNQRLTSNTSYRNTWAQNIRNIIDARNGYSPGSTSHDLPSPTLDEHEDDGLPSDQGDMMARRCARKLERGCCLAATYSPLLFVYGLTTWGLWAIIEIGKASPKSSWLGRFRIHGTEQHSASADTTLFIRETRC